MRRHNYDQRESSLQTLSFESKCSRSINEFLFIWRVKPSQNQTSAYGEERKVKQILPINPLSLSYFYMTLTIHLKKLSFLPISY